MIGDIRDWHAKHGDDWRATFGEIKANYGYDKYGGNCHMVPNHGLIVHGLLHGNGRLPTGADGRQHTSGWGHRLQLGQSRLPARYPARPSRASTRGPDWRGAVLGTSAICRAPTAGSGVTDAVTQATPNRHHRSSSWGGQRTSRRRTVAPVPLSPIPGRCRASPAHQCVVNNREGPGGERCLAHPFRSPRGRQHGARHHPDVHRLPRGPPVISRAAATD